jgi:hypothetical protein
MRPCPQCGGSGGEHVGGNGPAYAPPSAPPTRAGRVKSFLINLIVLGGLAAYVCHTTR